MPKKNQNYNPDMEVSNYLMRILKAIEKIVNGAPNKLKELTENIELIANDIYCNEVFKREIAEST